MRTSHYEKSSIGGWLGLLMGYMVYTAIRISGNLLGAIVLVVSPVDKVPVSFIPLWVVEVITIVLTIQALIHLIKADARFRNIFVYVAALEILRTCILYILYAVFIGSPEAMKIAITNVGISVVHNLIWVCYVFMSKRMSNRLDTAITDVIAEPVDWEVYNDGKRFSYREIR